MNETEINEYLTHPNTTILNGFLFKINYPNLTKEVSSEIMEDEIRKINTNYTNLLREIKCAQNVPKKYQNISKNIKEYQSISKRTFGVGALIP